MLTTLINWYFIFFDFYLWDTWTVVVGIGTVLLLSPLGVKGVRKLEGISEACDIKVEQLIGSWVLLWVAIATGTAVMLLLWPLAILAVPLGFYAEYIRKGKKTVEVKTVDLEGLYE